MTLFVIIASLFLDRILDAGKSLRWLKFIDELVNHGLEHARDNIWLGSLVFPRSGEGWRAYCITHLGTRNRTRNALVLRLRRTLAAAAVAGGRCRT